MRTLSYNEQIGVSGGIAAEAVVVGAFVGLTTLCFLSAISTPYYVPGPKIVYEPVVSSYDVITPVYENGMYVGDMVDTYTTTDYMPVRVY